MIPMDFHFLRPEWLMALLPAALVIAFAWNRLQAVGAGDWGRYVDAHLMAHLAVKGAAPRAARAWVVALGVALVCMVLAMAGPAWQKLPVSAYGGAQPTVVVLSLSQSMNSTDLVPNRMARAGHKLRDILDQTKGGDAALIIYADRPFVAAPLTSDTEVIRQMLPELSTGLMPVLGNRLDLALTEAQDLLARSGATKGRIVVIAGDTGLDPAASLKAAAAAKAAGYNVSVLGVGTAGGANLQTAQGSAIRAQDGSSITAKLDVAGLTKLAQAGGGAFSTVTADGSDIAKILPRQPDAGTVQGKPVDLMTDSWNDVGYLLLLLPLLLAPFAFRRGLLFMLSLFCLGMAMAPGDARADTWSDLWQTRDQQGQAAFAAGDYAKAATAFDSPERKGSALYRAGDFAAAAQAYADASQQAALPSQTYNLGTALAKSGKLKEALAAYDTALASAPNDDDLKFNRDLVAKLLEQQKQEQQKQDEQKQDKPQKSDKGQDQSQPKDQAGQDQASKDASGKDGSGNEGGQNKQDQPNTADNTPGQEAKGGAQSDQQSGDGKGKSAQGKPDASQAKGSVPDTDQQAQSDAAKSNDSTGSKPVGQDAEDKAEAGQSAAQNAGDAQQSGLKDTMDKALAAKAAEGAPSEEAPTDQSAGQGMGQALDQATEQQLRAVPDDPSGLLRARIHQYYARLRAAGQ